MVLEVHFSSRHYEVTTNQIIRNLRSFERSTGMVFTRVNGKYSLEAKNLTKEEFCEGLRQLTVMLHEEKDKTEDVMFVTDLIESDAN